MKKQDEKQDEMNQELAETDALLREIAEYQKFVGGDEELTEEDLDLASAAGISARYAAFLQKAGKMNSGTPGEGKE